MIDWYVEISEGAPEGFKGDKYLGNVIDTASPCMDYFCNRLTEMKDWKLEDANTIFKEIIEELPIMTARIYNNEFIIRYNNWVYIKLTETATQIYRDSKIKQILAYE
jgi:CRISPR/Cas system-associated protein Csx1